jgi:hypothetical protein
VQQSRKWVLPENGAVVKPETQQSLTAKTIQIFRLDGINVPQGTFALDDPNRYILLHQADDVTLIINGFTTREKFFEFGDNNGWDFRRGEQIQEHLAAYAESSGAIAEEEATGEIPKWWNQYASDYISTHLRANTTLGTRSVITDLYTDPVRGGRRFSLPSMFAGHAQVPSLWIFGMDNNISSYRPLTLAQSWEYAYDGKWFRSRMFVTTHGQGKPTINLDGAASIFDDKTSSWLTLGL